MNTFYILLLLASPAIIVALITISDKRFKSVLLFHNYFPKYKDSAVTFYFIPRMSAGIYNTGWFTPRRFGDGIPDPKHKGQFKAPTTQVRSFQIGFEIIWLFWGITFSRVAEEKR